MEPDQGMWALRGFLSLQFLLVALMGLPIGGLCLAYGGLWVDPDPHLAWQAVRVAGAVLLITLVPRYLNLLGAGVRQAVRRQAEVAQLLPSQRKVVENLRRNTGTMAGEITRHGAAAVTVSLRARWGAGKSACLRALQSQVEHDGSGVVVWFDCWRHQADSQPELLLYLKMATQWHLLWPWGWLFVPWLRLGLTMVPVVAKSSWEWGGAKVELDGQDALRMPRALFWQRRFQTLVHVSGKRLVVVLEDIDRCSASAAQAYVTLIRRFLSVDHVSIVVPHVEDQLRPKVFHPLMPQLPDLAATTDAVLWQVFGEQLLGKDGALTLAMSEGEGLTLDQDKRAALVRGHCLAAFARSPAPERERVFRLLEEKYICDRVVPVPPLAPDDLAYLVVALLKEEGTWRDRLGNPRDWATVQEPLAVHLTRAIPADVMDHHRVTPRQFTGAVSGLLSQFDQAADRDLEALWDHLARWLDQDSDYHLILGLVKMVAHMAFDLADQRALEEG